MGRAMNIHWMKGLGTLKDNVAEEATCDLGYQMFTDCVLACTPTYNLCSKYSHDI